MRDRNTFAKRQRETLKKQKAEKKRERRRNRKESTHVPESPDSNRSAPDEL
jgi:hypothetical protein